MRSLQAINLHDNFKLFFSDSGETPTDINLAKGLMGNFFDQNEKNLSNAS